ncbi:hypothetical protein F3Y22_tig00116937pilonHSYRG00133 [Hibiscus syriacus]|uniref:Uncharacterized protein n=1 Tax=Hibiscus syriacus TaxID=106335 RepID=A0A6A2WZJ4_HIBSY|nr:hypothetical protein F3Y22_tig00116937pilonHSYRG00133 [Hibiscus syriacus]
MVEVGGDIGMLNEPWLESMSLPMTETEGGNPIQETMHSTKDYMNRRNRRHSMEIAIDMSSVFIWRGPLWFPQYIIIFMIIGSFKASWQELAGVLVFSAIPFAAVKVIANSPLGESLQRQLLKTKKEALENSSRVQASAQKARNER